MVGTRPDLIRSAGLKQGRKIMSDSQIVAIGLLTERALARLGHNFTAAIPIVDATLFDDLLAKLDRIEVEPLGKGVALRPEK